MLRGSSLLILEIPFPSFLFLRFVQYSQNGKRPLLKIKDGQSNVVDVENIPLIHQDEEDYDDYNIPSRIDETSFTVPNTTEPTSTLRLRQKLKRDKIVSLYRYLGVTGDPGLLDLD